MIKIRKAEERGQANFGWLDANYTFSFARYYDPEHMGFRVLRVMNEDTVQPDNGFDTHPHKNMEILTYVLEGELEHKDSMGNGSIIKAGEVQMLSAGSGITHSEFNPSKSQEVHLYQIWMIPEKEGLTPSYQQASLHDLERRDQLQPFVRPVAGEDDSASTLTIHQDVTVYSGIFSPGSECTLPLKGDRRGWLQVVRGKLQIDGQTLSTSDGAALEEEQEPTIRAEEETEILFFDLP